MSISLGLSHETFSSLALMFTTVRSPGAATGAEAKIKHTPFYQDTFNSNYMYFILLH